MTFRLWRCFFRYLEIFGWEQLKKAPCKWSKSWWKRPKKVGQGLQSPLLSNARKKVFLWGGVSLYCNIWNTTYFTRQSNGRCSSKSRFRLHIVQGLRTKEISPTSPLRFVLITCISFSNINHILLRKKSFQFTDEPVQLTPDDPGIIGKIDQTEFEGFE